MTLEQLADRVSAAIWNLHPGWAVAAGRHEYDGQVPDLSAGAIEAGLDRLGRLREQLAGLADLSPEQEADRAILLGIIDRERFDEEIVRRWRRDPGWYLEPLDVSVYLERDYAPAGLRLERAAAALGETGGLLACARQNLDPVIPRLWAESAEVQARGLAGRLVAQAEWAPAARSAPGEAAWLRETAGFAAAELEAYAAWLKAERLPPATEEFALGPGGFDRWLRAAEGLGPAADRWSTWEARLQEDGEALAADAAVLAPGRSIGEACRAVEAEVEADPVAAVRRAVGEARRCAGEAVPGDDPQVAAAPGRGEPGCAGWLQAPGPYDDAVTRAVLYVTPGSSRAALDSLVATETLPGRLLALRRAAGAAGEARRRFPSRGFLEGWSLHAGDLLAEAGFREEAPGWRLLWRRRVVVAGCRLACAPRLHSGDLTAEQAEQVFIREAGLDRAAASAEARGCAADPGTALGGLGRLEILEARRRWDGSPAAFHEGLLGGAALPLGLLDRLPPS
ncbi:MAG: DUF885 domain-containing protein [Acidimicrobiia bacterium]|nr:DUF885 domain-containing protein [Acidimicrobiia bacterium]